MLKNSSVYFLVICTKLPSKIEKLELEVVSVVIVERGFCFQASQ